MRSEALTLLSQDSPNWSLTQLPEQAELYLMPKGGLYEPDRNDYWRLEMINRDQEVINEIINIVQSVCSRFLIHESTSTRQIYGIYISPKDYQKLQKNVQKMALQNLRGALN